MKNMNYFIFFVKIRTSENTKCGFKSRTGHHIKRPRSDELLGFFFVFDNFLSSFANACCIQI